MIPRATVAQPSGTGPTPVQVDEDEETLRELALLRKQMTAMKADVSRLRERDLALQGVVTALYPRSIRRTSVAAPSHSDSK